MLQELKQAVAPAIWPCVQQEGVGKPFIQGLCGGGNWLSQQVPTCRVERDNAGRRRVLKPWKRRSFLIGSGISNMISVDTFPALVSSNAPH